MNNGAGVALCDDTIPEEFTVDNESEVTCVYCLDVIDECRDAE